MSEHHRPSGSRWVETTRWLLDPTTARRTPPGFHDVCDLMGEDAVMILAAPNISLMVASICCRIRSWLVSKLISCRAITSTWCARRDTQSSLNWAIPAERESVLILLDQIRNPLELVVKVSPHGSLGVATMLFWCRRIGFLAGVVVPVCCLCCCW